MTDLTDFLLARIAEDEATARDASGRGASWDVAIQRPVEWGEDWPDTDILSGGKPILRNYVEYAGINEVEHVVTWDPARVLAECDGKRRIIEMMTSDLVGDVMLADETLKQLALPYADHPDWREEWRPWPVSW